MSTITLQIAFWWNIFLLRKDICSLNYFFFFSPSASQGKLLLLTLILNPMGLRVVSFSTEENVKYALRTQLLTMSLCEKPCWVVLFVFFSRWPCKKLLRASFVTKPKIIATFAKWKKMRIILANLIYLKSNANFQM